TGRGGEEAMSDFELVLFSVDPDLVRRAVSAGVDSLIVDWEHLDKEARQRGADTEINRHTAQDLRRGRAATDARVLCRVNALGSGSGSESERAIEAGADEVLLPMVRNAAQVEEAFALAGRRCRLGILLETADALENAGELGQLPLSRAYVGLNDLA